MREGPNAGKAPLGVIAAAQPLAKDSTLAGVPHFESDAIIYELHVRGFTMHPNSGVERSRAGTLKAWWRKFRT